MTSLLRATSQHKKLRNAGSVFFTGVALAAIAKWVADSASFQTAISIGVGGAALAIISAFYAVLSVRCPGCGLRWVGWSISNQAHTQWLHWLYRFTECPKCGYTSTTADPP